MFGPQCEFILEMDASGVRLGAILGQKQVDGSIYPLAYASQACFSVCNTAELGIGSGDRVMNLAVVRGDFWTIFLNSA